MNTLRAAIEANRNRATSKQRAFMEDRDIYFTDRTSKEEASLFIQQYLDDVRERAADYDSENYGDRPWRD